MRKKTLFFLVYLFTSAAAFSQWQRCNTPSLARRVDDLFMLNTRVGYAVGYNEILKTIDGVNWTTLINDTAMYYRSVEFINENKGFVGGFPVNYNYTSNKNVFRETLDGGATWIDLTPKLNDKAKDGICGLAVADSNTIYGCGNWYDTSGYIIKSSDGGNTWSFIDMGKYASSLIDMYFINKDTGFVTGQSSDAFHTAIILYTTDGGVTWTTKFRNTTLYEYCWKIQRLTDQIYFASIQDEVEASAVTPHILKSIDGGMTWTKNLVIRYNVGYVGYIIQGVGFLNDKIGFTGGDLNADYSFRSVDGGVTWARLNACPAMDRVFKVNDTLLFATGWQSIWKYIPSSHDTIVNPPPPPGDYSFSCYPNPVNTDLTVVLQTEIPTHALIILFDDTGKRVEVVDNSNKLQGKYLYNIHTAGLSSGKYFLYLQTHDYAKSLKLVIAH